MQPLFGSELSRMRAEDLRSRARPEPRARRGLRRALGVHLVGAGVRLLGARRRVA